MLRCESTTSYISGMNTLIGYVRGLLNPREVDDTWGHGGLMFALRPAPEPDGPELRMWPAGEAERGGGRQMCLGRGSLVLRGLEACCDVYGLVDSVLNFVETNHVGAMPLGEPTMTDRFTSLLDCIF
jgi:hypothetical protein